MLHGFQENVRIKFIERLLTVKLVLLAISFLLLGALPQVQVDLNT